MWLTYSHLATETPQFYGSSSSVMETCPQCIPWNSSNPVGLCGVFRRCAAGRLNPEHIGISMKSSNSKSPGSCLPGPKNGADNEIRVFEPLAITGSQPVEIISTHSFHQKSHSYATFVKLWCNLSSSFSSTLGESSSVKDTFGAAMWASLLDLAVSGCF